MRTQAFCLALAIVLLCPFASAQWVQTNGPYGGNIHSVFLSGTRLFAATDSGVYLSTSDGANWNPVNSGLTSPNYVTAFGVSGAHLFAGISAGMPGYVFLSTDNGTNWSATSYAGGSVRAFAVSGGNLFAGGGSGYGGGVLLTTDNGTSWTAANTGLPGDKVDALAISGTNLFAALAGVSKNDFPGVYLSTKEGANWTAVNNGLPKNQLGYNKGVHCLGVNGTNLFAGTYDGVFLSSDDGTNWTAANNGLTNLVVNALAIFGTNLFAGTDGGVFLSTNSGVSWTQVTAGLTDTNITCLAVNGTILFAVAGSGLWRRPLLELVSVNEPIGGLPAAYGLHQNCPNPFNPSTTIKYELPKSSVVRLSVYDMLGREVSVLVNERRNAGIHEVTFDGSNLASGAYFYRLQAGDFVQTRKLLLMH